MSSQQHISGMQVDSPNVAMGTVPPGGTFEYNNTAYMRVAPQSTSIGTVGDGQVWAVDLSGGTVAAFDQSVQVQARLYRAVPATS